MAGPSEHPSLVRNTAFVVILNSILLPMRHSTLLYCDMASPISWLQESLNSSNAGAELPSWSEQQLDPSYPPTHITTASMDQLEVPCATKAQPTASTDAPEAGSPQQPIPAFSQEFLLKAAAKQGHRLPRSPALQQKLLAKLTHLHLNALQLQQLSSIRLCSRLQVSHGCSTGRLTNKSVFGHP